MALIKNRIELRCEEFLNCTQFGFRKRKSTAHAIFFLRRIQDLAEAEGSPLSILFLDWEKAFDKVNHHKLYETLHNIGVSKHIIKNIEYSFTHDTFFVQDIFGTSTIKKQHTGIRQGCPLSPYLFILLMADVDNKVKNSVSRNIVQNRIPNFPHDAIYYADDTILFSKDNQTLVELLHLFQFHSAEKGINLNKHKCEIINMNTDGAVEFLDGEQVIGVTKANYLGNLLFEKLDPAKELNKKFVECNITWQRLERIWNKNRHDKDKKWKLLVFEAVINAKLLYGLETVKLNDTAIKKIDAFYIRKIRRILGWAPTFVDRTKTNALLINEYERITSTNRKGAPKQFTNLSTRLTLKQVKLLGHIIRASEHDPLRQITLKNGTAESNLPNKRRVGRPRKNWIFCTKRFIYNDILMKTDEFTDSQAQNQLILNEANNRNF